MVRLVSSCCVSCVGAARPASAQEPYNLTAPVTNLATIFTDLFGPHGLIVDSQATLPGEQPHSAHFNSDFQFNFSQFSTALVSQLVSVPLPSPAAASPTSSTPASACSSARRRASGRFSPIAPKPSARGACRSALRISDSRSTRVEGIDLHKRAGGLHARQRGAARRPRGRGDDDQLRSRRGSARRRRS